MLEIHLHFYRLESYELTLMKAFRDMSMENHEITFASPCSEAKLKNAFADWSNVPCRKPLVYGFIHKVDNNIMSTRSNLDAVPKYCNNEPLPRF